MKVRAYRPDDLDATVALWYRSWTSTFPDLRHPQSFNEWKTRFQQKILTSSTTWIAEIEGVIAGFMTIVEQDGYIDQLFVDPDFQGRGIGSGLMELAKRLSPGGLSLHTLQQNVSARTFYEKLGFKAGAVGVNRVNGQPNIEYHWEPSPDVASTPG